MAVEPNRWGIIYNPKAGSRKAQKRWAKIREYMDNQNVKYDYVQSEGFGSVERLARTLANNGYKTIVVVGGDGAINDAVNGIMQSDVEDKHEIAFGIIPNGIGNDFAKYWGLDSDDFKGAVDVLINRRLRKVDIGVFSYYNGDKHNERYFLNAVYMFHNVKGLLKVMACACPAPAVGEPDKCKAVDGICLKRQRLIASRSFVELAPAAAVKIGLDSVNHAGCPDDKIKTLFHFALI